MTPIQQLRQHDAPKAHLRIFKAGGNWCLRAEDSRAGLDAGISVAYPARTVIRLLKEAGFANAVFTVEARP